MILIINRRKSGAESVAEMLRFMGILAYAATPQEALKTISSRFRAALIMNPTSLPDYREFLKRLRSYASSVPIFSLQEAKEDSELEGFDESYPFSIYSSNLAEKIIEHSRKKRILPIGDYRLAGIDASCYSAVPCYFGVPLATTKTEGLIIKYLIRSYPTPASADEILKYCYKPSRAPIASSIRTHISIINKKNREILKHPLIIFIKNEGYIIYTPEIKNKYSIE